LHYRGVGTNSYLSRTSVSHKEPQKGTKSTK
jgi:hypothetical protein